MLKEAVLIILLICLAFSAGYSIGTISATKGSVTENNTYVIYTVANASTFTVPPGATCIDYFVVDGGEGSGCYVGNATPSDYKQHDGGGGSGIQTPTKTIDDPHCVYMPHLVQFQVLQQPKHTFREWFNHTIFWEDGFLHTIQTPANVTITATPDYTDLQETRQMLSQFGIYSPEPPSDNLTRVGITDNEGKAVLPLHKSIKYNIMVTSEERGIYLAIMLYPQESDYGIWVR